jgi:hypothetical protein
LLAERPRWDLAPLKLLADDLKQSKQFSCSTPLSA